MHWLWGTPRARQRFSPAPSMSPRPMASASPYCSSSARRSPALDEVMYLRSASTASDFAERALAAGLPPDPHRGENWALAALYALLFSDHLDAAQSQADEILARARERGAAVTVVTISAFRAW